jgi:superfamily II DNA helicase RecQ
MPSGVGKSAICQVAAVCARPALVIRPLLWLQQDQAALKARLSSIG